MLQKTARPRYDDVQARSEAALVAAARLRDEAAVRELVRRLNRRLFRVARGIVESDAEAEDVVQDAWLSAFTHLDSFQGTARFSTWITRIAINAALMRRRAARPLEEYDTVAEPAAAQAEIIDFPGRHPEAADAALGRSEVRAFLETAVADLPSDLRLVFLLREAEGLSVQDIARDLSLNPITVKTRLFRARRLLRRALQARLEGDFDAVFPFAGVRCGRMADRVAEGLSVAGWIGN
ncbi:MAG TPA: RNA polymerase sigma factor [Paracoccus sp. (in: a-proteobacteria)]|nr:RNA polymerase sigma factor [Paracoccus sp. (in: a-proteobacteria)]